MPFLTIILTALSGLERASKSKITQKFVVGRFEDGSGKYPGIFDGPIRPIKWPVAGGALFFPFIQGC
jgi:hypothetical protein